MDEFYYAHLDLLYDLAVERRTTTPSPIEQKIHRIKPVDYLVLSGTDRVFPEDLFGDLPQCADSYYGRKEGELNWHTHKSEGTDLVTVVYVAISLAAEAEKSNTYLEGALSLVFKPGGLEKRIESAKKAFVAKLEAVGLKPDPNEIYLRLCGGLGGHRS